MGRPAQGVAWGIDGYTSEWKGLLQFRISEKSSKISPSACHNDQWDDRRMGLRYVLLCNPLLRLPTSWCYWTSPFCVDDLRMLRNEIAHWPQAYISYPAFSSICIRAEAAFKSLNLPTIPLQIIREKVHFSVGSTKERVSLQFFKGKSCFYLTSF